MLTSKLFNLVILWFLRKCFAGLHLINAFIQSADPSRSLIIEFHTVAFDLKNGVKLQYMKNSVKLKCLIFCVLLFVVWALFVTSGMNFLQFYEKANGYLFLIATG